MICGYRDRLNGLWPAYSQQFRLTAEVKHGIREEHQLSELICCREIRARVVLARFLSAEYFERLVSMHWRVIVEGCHAEARDT
jgi:hypothetical protein